MRSEKTRLVSQNPRAADVDRRARRRRVVAADAVPLGLRTKGNQEIAEAMRQPQFI